MYTDNSQSASITFLSEHAKTEQSFILSNTNTSFQLAPALIPQFEKKGAIKTLTVRSKGDQREISSSGNTRAIRI